MFLNINYNKTIVFILKTYNPYTYHQNKPKDLNNNQKTSTP